MLPPLPLAAQAQEAPLALTQNHRPYGDRSATLVPLKNVGEGSVLVRSVEFHATSTIETPDRDNLYATATPLRVHFLERHRRAQGQYLLALERPLATNPDSYATLELAIIEPTLPKKTTYVGTVTVSYDQNNKTRTEIIPNVELDVLSGPPPNPDLKKTLIKPL